MGNAIRRHRGRIEIRQIETARDNADAFGCDALTCDDRLRGEHRRRDDPVAAADRAERERGDPQARRRQIGQLGDEMKTVALRCGLRNACRGGVPGMDNIDALGSDELIERIGVGAPFARVEFHGGEWQPLAAEALQVFNEFAAFAGDDRACADLHQRASDIDRGARLRRVAKRCHDLQNGRSGQRARQRAGAGGVCGVDGRWPAHSCSLGPLPVSSCVWQRVAAKHGRSASATAAGKVRDLI